MMMMMMMMVVIMMMTTIIMIMMVMKVPKFYHYAIETYGGVEARLREFLTSAAEGGEWSATRVDCLALGVRGLGIR
jgi:hypothetical protein